MSQAFHVGDIIRHQNGRDNALVLDIYPLDHEKNPYALKSAYLLLFMAVDHMPETPVTWSTKVIDEYYTRVA